MRRHCPVSGADNNCRFSSDVLVEATIRLRLASILAASRWLARCM